MIKPIKYFTLGAILFTGASCSDQLRIDERETAFDVNYYTYSRYQLTTAIVNVGNGYGSSVKNPGSSQAALYFMNCYSGDQIGGFYTKIDQNWRFEDVDPYAGNGADRGGILRTLSAINTLATNEGNLANVAASDILKCVVGGYMTEKYGDIPFSEAIQGRTGNLFPKFDAQKEVYEQMFTLLDNAVKTLSDGNSKGLPSDHDILFKGDKTKWIKFANSLKFRLMMHSYEAFKKAGKDLAPEMEAIAKGGNYISGINDNASFVFSGIEERQSWFFQNKWGTGNTLTEKKPTKYLIDQMVALDDPRMYVIFAPALTPISSRTEAQKEDIKINGFTYTINYQPAKTVDADQMDAAGRDLDGKIIAVPYKLDAKWIGTPNPTNVHLLYAGNSLPGGNGFYDNRRLTSLSKLMAMTNDNRLRAVMMEASEMMFLLAEARQKGLISTGTVKDYYNNGIKQSFERWQIENGTKPATHIGSDKIVDNFDAYCAKAGVVLDGTAADLDKIALQKWLSFVMTNQTEAFTEVIRTGKPSFVSKIADSFSNYDYPKRYVYPLDERSNNKEKYDAAVLVLGGKDLPSSATWIQK